MPTVSTGAGSRRNKCGFGSGCSSSDHSYVPHTESLHPPGQKPTCFISVGHQNNATIAAIVGCSAVWVRQIIHCFNGAGIDGITWYPWFQTRSARVFTADIREHIVEIALSSPIALIGMSQWSVPKLRQYLIEQKIIAHISICWLGEILHRYKVRLRRTKTWKESTDPLFAQKTATPATAGITLPARLPQAIPTW